MGPARTGCLALIVLAVVFLTGTAAAFIINNDFGRLEVKTVEIPDGEHYISGVLYRPRAAAEENPLPAVVLVHGISSAKESMSSIALELARRGFVALSIDVVGHGDSGGRLGATKDPSLGALAALRYAETLPYVDASSLGLVGHSLGAGAVRAAAAAHRRVKATVLIAGGLGGMASSPLEYGVLNTTFPKNLLVAIGREDVLFNLDQVTEEWLPPVFGVQEVSPGRLYGDFNSGTARKLVAPATTHLLEPLDPTIVSETVVWMGSALKPSETSQIRRLEEGLTYPYRETMMLLSVFSLVGLTFPVSLLILLRKPSNKSSIEYGSLKDWKIMVIWGGLSIVLLLPTFILGFSLSFPPVLFGSSIAWWLLMVATAGVFLILLVMPRFSGVRLRIRRLASESFTWRETCVAISLFLMLYIIVYLIDLFLGVNLWIFVPIFKVLRIPARITLFLTFIPFFLVFFYVEGIYLHVLRMGGGKNGFLPEALEMGRTIGIKITPYILVMGTQYIPMFLFEFKPLTSFLGFLIEFLPLITVLFIISTACSWWFHRLTSSIGTGTVFNALLFAWISAGVFPFGAFG
ncbi:MAG: alpha/beta fold hydrolase [Candidatus Brockarchaeota archaeon]|nr:alpha/beta fold hydrolase [Candidatus Brockarchaeota archaeon]